MPASLRKIENYSLIENSIEITSFHTRDLRVNLDFPLPSCEEDDFSISSVDLNGVNRRDSLLTICEESTEPATEDQLNHSCLSSIVQMFGCKRRLGGDLLYQSSPLLPLREMTVRSGPVQSPLLMALIMSGVRSMAVQSSSLLNYKINPQRLGQ